MEDVQASVVHAVVSDRVREAQGAGEDDLDAVWRADCAPGRYSVRLDDLILAPSLQPRSGVDPRTVNRYARFMLNGVRFPPVIACAFQTGDVKRIDDFRAIAGGVKAETGKALVVIDGWHRIHARHRSTVRRLLGDAVEVEIVEAGQEQARWLAFKLNMGHGKQLSRAERAEALNAYVIAGQHFGAEGEVKSARAIGADIGMSHQAVLDRLKRNWPRIYRAMKERLPQGAKRRRKKRDPAKALVEDARTLLAQATAILGELHEIGPDDRAQLVEAAERALRAAKDEAIGVGSTDSDLSAYAAPKNEP